MCIIFIYDLSEEEVLLEVDGLEEEYVFFNTYEENDTMYLIVCESEEQGKEYLIKEKGLSNPELTSIKKIKRDERFTYPCYLAKFTLYNEVL